MQRFVQLAEEEGFANAQAHWSDLVYYHTWFLIPNTIHTDRTFVRSPLEAYYVETMHAFIANATDNDFDLNVNIGNLPLAALRQELQGRWWAQFGRMTGLRLEQMVAEHHRLFIPVDYADTRVVPNNLPYLREVYPRAPDWYTATRFPAALTFPLPFVIFYYHTRIRAATGEREIAFWDTILQLEVALLFATAWYNDATRGRRGYVLPADTIQWLRVRLGNQPIAAGAGPGGLDVLFPFVANLMEAVLNRDARERNLVQLRALNLPDVNYIWTQVGTGYVDTQTRGGRVLEPRRGGRLFFVDTGRGPAMVNFRYRNQEDYTVRP